VREAQQAGVQGFLSKSNAGHVLWKLFFKGKEPFQLETYPLSETREVTHFPDKRRMKR